MLLGLKPVRLRRSPRATALPPKLIGTQFYFLMEGTWMIHKASTSIIASVNSSDSWKAFPIGPPSNGPTSRSTRVDHAHGSDTNATGVKGCCRRIRLGVTFNLPPIQWPYGS